MFQFGQPISAHTVIALPIALVTVLFLLSGAPGFRFRFRHEARVAALAIYGAVIVGVAVWVALWALGVQF